MSYVNNHGNTPPLLPLPLPTLSQTVREKRCVTLCYFVLWNAEAGMDEGMMAWRGGRGGGGGGEGFFPAIHFFSEIRRWGFEQLLEWRVVGRFSHRLYLVCVFWRLDTLILVIRWMLVREMLWRSLDYRSLDYRS